MAHYKLNVAVVASVLLLCGPDIASSETCDGPAVSGIRGLAKAHALADGSLAGKGKVNINIDGYGRAYHPQNARAGALIHLCNAGEVFLPDGTHYYGSESNATCTGKFMADFAKIKAAKWNSPDVGAIRWFGILGVDSVTVGGQKVKGVKPVEQADGSGFFVSPTTLADETVHDQAVQSRYVHPLRVPAAVIGNQRELSGRGIVMGSFGVAYDPKTQRTVPFIVGDFGPRIGEATPALARSLANLPITDDVTRNNRYAGQVDAPRVVWVFFGKTGGTIKYKQDRETDVNAAAKDAFQKWGGQTRLACVASAL
ncbi:hypothetical protein [Pleomorphomonas sp. PLEO]|uniref:hypothetical protein n=1 Tax=Pleomorphomonas sp. PLEO TaxID=3239306 RepID=UPI00351E79A7